MIEIFYLKKKKFASIFLEGPMFFFFILPLHFCLQTLIFFYQSENHVNVTFLSLKKKSLLRLPHFRGKSVFFFKLSILRSLLFWGKSEQKNFFPSLA